MDAVGGDTRRLRQLDDLDAALSGLLDELDELVDGFLRDLDDLLEPLLEELGRKIALGDRGLVDFEAELHQELAEDHGPSLLHGASRSEEAPRAMRAAPEVIRW